MKRKKDHKPNTTVHIAWHPAFVEAIQLELEDYQDILEFFTEYPLISEPLRIDCVIIKKTKDLIISKNIGAIFREVNLLEYKSPDDYISLADFYKVYAYACLYSSLENTPITSLTISLIESHHPKELLSHLKKVRGYTVEKKNPGIYTIKGDILPIQIIDSRQLSEDEYLWLKGLSNKLDPFTVIKVSNEAVKLNKTAKIKAYMDVIIRANINAIEEVMNMSSTAKSLEEVMERTGFTARVEAKAEERKALAIAQNMVNLGLSLKTIVSATRLDVERVKELYKR